MADSEKTPCKHGDPSCPCQDGDSCHYEGANPWPEPSTQQKAAWDEQRVKEKWPEEEYGTHIGGSEELGYKVWVCFPQQGDNAMGRGDTPTAAWADAASRLSKGE